MDKFMRAARMIDTVSMIKPKEVSFVSVQLKVIGDTSWVDVIGHYSHGLVEQFSLSGLIKAITAPLNVFMFGWLHRH